jgi:hypothetical protein
MPRPQKPKRKIVPPSPPERKERPIPRQLMGIADAPDGEQPDSAHPSWRLALLDLEHAGSWSWQVGEVDLKKIVGFLTEMERLTWSQVKAQITSSKRGSHRKHHAMPSEDLGREAQQRLREHQLEGFELFRFRLGNNERLWGLIEKGVFYPVWWDPNHEVYPLDD